MAGGRCIPPRTTGGAWCRRRSRPTSTRRRAPASRSPRHPRSSRAEERHLEALGDVVGDHRRVELQVLVGDRNGRVSRPGRASSARNRGLGAVEQTRPLLLGHLDGSSSLAQCPSPKASPSFPVDVTRRDVDVVRGSRLAPPSRRSLGHRLETTATVTRDPGAPQKSGFDTRAIHAGYEPDPTTGAVIPPIYATSTYKQDGVGGLRGGYEYSRSANPTRTALEERWPRSRRGSAASRSPAGWPQRTRSCARSPAGDHVVIPDDAYGGTFRLFDKVASPGGSSTPRSRSPTSTPCGARSAPARPGWCGSRRPPTRCSTSATSRPWLGRPRGRRAARRRQHLRLAVPPAAAQPRRRRRRPLHDQVRRRAQRRRRWRRRRPRPRPGRGDHVPPERDGCGGGAVRLLPDPPGHQDARGTDGPPLRQRRARRGVPRRHPRSATSTSRDCPTTRSRGRGPADEALRRDRVLPLSAASRPRSRRGRAEVFALGESLGGVESLSSIPRMTT